MDCNEFMGGITINFKVEKKEKIILQISSLLDNNNIYNLSEIKQVKNGRNSKVFIAISGDKKHIIKKYHYHLNDLRNRLDNEFRFLTYLKDYSIDRVAKPIDRDDENHLGLYSYIKGKVPDSINQNIVNQATNFIFKINEHRDTKLAKNLSNASESCFSIISHINSVENRINNLKNIISNEPLMRDFSSFVNLNLNNTLEKIKNNFSIKFNSKEIQQNLLNIHKIISPSDFGFHNTLLKNDKLYFLDFEYAGWDDPAKLICDFICHPEIPVNEQLSKLFSDSIVSWLKTPEDMNEKIRALLPLYRLKWCCIILNEFTSVGRDRRMHSGNTQSLENQLKKSVDYFKEYFNSIN